MNKYIEGQFKKIGLYIQNNTPINEYKQYNDTVKIKLHFVNGQSNWLNLNENQLIEIYKILSN
jgi:hypothetical protein